MANSTEQKKGWIGRISDGARKAGDLLLGGSLADMTPSQANQHAASRLDSINQFDADYVGVEMLMGSSSKPIRSRAELYMKYQFMMQEGLVSTALRNNVQMALGGH